MRTTISARLFEHLVRWGAVAGCPIRTVATVTAVLTLLIACGDAEHGSPTISPTAVPVRPTSTPIPQTAVPSPSTSSADQPGLTADDWLDSELSRGEAVVWYLGHCGFAIRTQNHLLIFDYQEERDGQVPRARPARPSIENGFIVPDQIRDLRVRVFVTHEHADHFDPVIFEWKETVPDIAYYFGWRARATDDPSFHFLVGPRAEVKSGDLEISTVNSYHSGVPEVAYLVRVDGLVIYHNGDYRGEYEADYPFLRELVDRIDLTFAFRDFNERNRYFEQNIDLFQRFEHRAIFPMHDSAENGRYAEFESVYLSHLPDLPIFCPQKIGERFLFRQGQITREGETSVPPAETPVPPATPEAPTSTPIAPLTGTAPAPGQVSFVDSGQALGNERSQHVSLGDLDGDGDLDALVGNQGKAQLWFNDGGGLFSEIHQELEIESGWDMSLDLGDLDGDGDLDAFVVVMEGTGRVLLNEGGIQGGIPGTLQDSGQRLSIRRAFCVALGDLDGDGDLDAYVGQERSNTVWLNDGQGTYTNSGQALGRAITADVALADLEGDGDLDAFAGGWDEPGKVWLNDGTGVLSDSGHDHTPAAVHIHGLALGDLDGDGDLDAFLAVASGHPNQVWLNNGAGVYSDSGQRLRSALGHDVALGDLDGDGDLDAFMANGTGAGVGNTIWLNDGSGVFADSGLRLGSNYSIGVALGDLENDGDLDAVVANTSFLDDPVETPNEVWFNGTH